MLRTVLISLFFFVLSHAQASVVINEMMTRNLSSHIDDKFNYSSWVELYNSGDEDFNISNCLFADSKDNIWVCSLDSIVKPGDFFVFYFDELDVKNHANFKLDSDGGSLTLMHTDGTVLDYVEYPKGKRNVSYGRAHDGDDNWGSLSMPTPNTSNESAMAVKLQTKTPELSIPSGFYKGIQNLLIKTEEGSKIYFTTDGSEPTVNDSLLYSDTIRLDGTISIRTIAVAEGKLPSDIVTATYFVNEREMTLPVVSLVSDPVLLYSDSIGLFAKGVKKNWTVGKDCGAGVCYGNYLEDWSRPMYMEFFEDNTTSLGGLELKTAVSGACSRLAYLKSLKLKANKTYSGTKKLPWQFFSDKPNQKTRSILLRNAGNDHLRGHMRDALVHSLLIGQMDIDYQSYLPSIVFVNGKYHGLFNIRERSNDDYVYSNHGYEEDEICFPEDPNSLKNVECFHDVYVLQNATNINADSIYPKIEKYIDVDEFLNYFMVETFCANGDWGTGNLKLWKANENGKWRWILFDTDHGFGLARNHQHYTFENADRFPTFKKLIKNDRLANKFVVKNMIHMATTFSTSRVMHFIDSLSARIEPEIRYFYSYLDENKICTVYDWDDNVRQMKRFATYRPSYHMAFLGKYLSLGDTASFTITSNSDAKYMLNEEPVYVSTLKTVCYKGFPVSIIPIGQSNKVFSHWEVTKKGKGTYKDTSFVLNDAFSAATTYKAVFRDKQQEDYRPCEYLRVNEICIINNENEDEYGDFNDWVEIYNSSDQAVSLSGLYISDNKNDLKKYQFPSDLSKEDSALLMIPPKSYKIVWADSNTDKGPLHVNFSLSQKERETVSLSYGNYGFVNVIDSVSYDIHKIGESYAYFVRNGVPVWKTTSKSTFDGKNQIELVCPSDSLTNKVYDGISLMAEANVIGEYPGEEVVLKYNNGKDDIWSETAPTLSDVDSMTVNVKAIHSSYEDEECQYVLSIVESTRNDDDTVIRNYLSYEELQDHSGDIYRVYDFNGKLIRTAKNKIDLFQNLSGTYLICQYRDGRLVSVNRYLIEK